MLCILQVLGIAFDPRPDNTTTSQSGPNIPFIEAPHHAPPIRDPAPVHEYGIPPPVPGPGDFIPPVHHPVPTASHAHSAFAGVPSTAPETSAQLPQVAAAQDPAAVAAVAAPGYLKAINAAMSGATTGDHPILDAGNPGPETYMGTQVRGSVGSASVLHPLGACFSLELDAATARLYLMPDTIVPETLAPAVSLVPEL